MTVPLLALFVIGMALAQPVSAANVGAGVFQFSGCLAVDATTFSFEDNGDGTFTFSVVDVGLADCAWAHSDDLVGTGDLATGFTGAVSSGPWTVNADGTFSVTGLTFTFGAGGTGLGGGYSITGDANGIMA